MKAILWLIVACVGFGLMAWSYFRYQRVDETAPWACGVMYLAQPEVQEGVPPQEVTAISAPARLLPPAPEAAVLVNALAQSDNMRRNLEAQLSEKLIVVAPEDAGITEALLHEGRLPTAGCDEILAGYQASQKDQLTVAGRKFIVVGVLRRDVALLADAYLLPPSESLGGVFDRSDDAVREAVLLRLTPQQFYDRQFREQLTAAYPRDRFAPVNPAIRAEGGPYCLYVAGMALLLCGGSGGFIGLYAALARRVRWRAIRAPLEELERHHRLLWGVHLGYFGLVIVAALVIYSVPPLQTALLALVHGEVASGKGVLGVAGKAYLSKNIALAAVVTLAINFLGGSLLYITVPSSIIPGIGALTAAFRALMWGILLAPTFSILALAMLPHSWTLLLEGEGYILAAFFALLIPNYMCRPDMGGGVLRRYGRALLINAQGALLTFIVLAVAACYEAVEVILMSR